MPELPLPGPPAPATTPPGATGRKRPTAPARKGRWWTGAEPRTTRPAATEKDWPTTIAPVAASRTSCRNGCPGPGQTGRHSGRRPSRHTGENLGGRKEGRRKETPRPGQKTAAEAPGRRGEARHKG